MTLIPGILSKTDVLSSLLAIEEHNFYLTWFGGTHIPTIYAVVDHHSMCAFLWYDKFLVVDFMFHVNGVHQMKVRCFEYISIYISAEYFVSHCDLTGHISVDMYSSSARINRNLYRFMLWLYLHRYHNCAN